MLGTRLYSTYNQQDLVDLTICCKLYKVCNGRQIEPMRGTDFVDLLNLKPMSCEVKVRFRENGRLCYLFYTIAKETMNDHDAKEWIQQVLKRCGISYNYYKSHYKDAVSSGASDDNVQFVSVVKTAFEEAKMML